MKTTRKNLPPFKDTKAKKLFLTDEDKFKGLLKGFSAGYTRVPNELLFTAMNEKLPITCLKALLVTYRLTQGYKKSEARISYGYLAAILGSKYSSQLSSAMKDLRLKGYLKKNESSKTRINTYSLLEKAKTVSDFEVETDFSLGPKTRIDHLRNGKTSINNQFLLDLFHSSASASQVRLALCMIRFSLGMQKVCTEVEKSVLRKFSNLSPQSFNKALLELSSLGFLEIKEKNTLVKIKVPKKYTGFVLEKAEEEKLKPKKITLKTKTLKDLSPDPLEKSKSNTKSLEAFSKSRLEKKHGKAQLLKAFDFVKEHGSFSKKAVALPYRYLETGTTMERVLKEIEGLKAAEKRKLESQKQARLSAQMTKSSLEQRASKAESTIKMEKKVGSFLKVLTEKEKEALSSEYQAQKPFCKSLGLTSVLESYLLEPLYEAVLENPLFEKELMEREEKENPNQTLKKQAKKTPEPKKVQSQTVDPVSLKAQVASMTRAEKEKLLKPKSGGFSYDSPLYNALLEKKLKSHLATNPRASSFAGQPKSLQERKEKMLLQAERMIAMGY